MKNRSPMKIVELCIYVLVIIAALIWMFTGREMYNPPDYEPPAITQTAEPSELPPPVVPKGDVLPGR